MPRHRPANRVVRPGEDAGDLVDRVWEGLDPAWYVTRQRTRDDVLPWEHIRAGLHSDFLWSDWQEALHEHGLPDCRWTPCFECGVCPAMGTEIQAGPTGVTLLPLVPSGRGPAAAGSGA